MRVVKVNRLTWNENPKIAGLCSVYYPCRKKTPVEPICWLSPSDFFKGQK